MKQPSATNTLESMSQAVWYNHWTLQKFEQNLKGNILEVGCGIGNFTNTLARFGRIWAFDINNEHVKQTEKLVDGEIRVGFGDIENGKYFFKDQKFDTIVCLNVLEHIKDDSAALNNLFKLLKKEGRLILLVPSHQFLFGEIDKSIGHFRRYAKSQIVSKLEQTGFKIVSLRSLNFLGALGWFIAGKVLRLNTVGDTNVKIFNLIAPFILPLEDLFEPPIGTSILIIAKK